MSEGYDAVNNWEIWAEIEKLDFTDIKARYKSKKNFFWKLFYNADKIEIEYRQFLYLICTNPVKMIIPWSKNLDEFWHEHILDTKNYEACCYLIFGKYIHHVPGIPKDLQQHTKAYDKTKNLYKKVFSKKTKSVIIYCVADGSCEGN